MAIIKAEFHINERKQPKSVKLAMVDMVVAKE
jgi:hypothetical protein